jgi:6-phosphogluconate dehydrogenase
MELGMIGLGRMGLNMAIRLSRGGHKVIGCNRSKEPADHLVKEGGLASSSIEDLVKKLTSRRAVG